MLYGKNVILRKVKFLITFIYEKVFTNFKKLDNSYNATFNIYPAVTSTNWQRNELGFILGDVQTVAINSQFTIKYTSKNVIEKQIESECGITLFNDTNIGNPADLYFVFVGGNAITSNGKSSTAHFMTGSYGLSYITNPLILDPNETITCSMTFKAIKYTSDSILAAISMRYRPKLEFESYSYISHNGRIYISGSSTNKPVVQKTKITQQAEPKAPIAGATYPQEFIKEGSLTTDVSKLTLSQAQNVKDFRLEVKDIGYIIYKVPLNLSGEDLLEKFNNLSTYVIIRPGYIEIKSDQIAELNAQAQITMNNLNFIEGSIPVILKDGEPAEESVTNVTYSQGTLTFDVNGFSSYSVQPTMTLEDKSTDEKIIIIGKIDDLNKKVVVKFGEIEKLLFLDEKGSFEFETERENNDKATISFMALGVSGEKISDTITVQAVKGNEKNVKNLPFILIGLGILTLMSFTGIGLLVFKIG